MRSGTLTIENWMNSTVSFLCCFKGTGFEKESVYFELDLVMVFASLFCPDLAGGVLQKDDQTSSTGLLSLLFLFSFPLGPPCKAFMQNLSLIKQMTEISICQMYQNLPMNCMVILLIG